MSQTTSGLNISTDDFWALHRQQRLEYYKHLRANEPFSWHESNGSGFWAAARCDDVRTISRQPEYFCSSQGVAQTIAALAEFAEQMGGAAVEEAARAAQSFLMMDDPEHRRLRGLVQKAFTPPQVQRLEDQIVTDAKEIVDSIESEETGDFVERVSRWLPSITIARMLGIKDDETRIQLVRCIDAVFAFADPEFRTGDNPMGGLVEALVGEMSIAYAQIADARANPGGDGLVSSLVEVEEDGEKLTDSEIANFFVLLAGAGNDTTRNTTSWAMRALTQNRDQRALLIEDPSRYATGVEEFIRWATPVTNFMRTVTSEVRVGDHVFHEGEKAMMLYESANRDGSVFDEPDRFDVLRSPNPHVAFGGGGPHFCLGTALARTQLRALFSELLRQFPDLEVAEPEYMVHNLMAAPKRMAMDAGRRAV